MARTPDVADVLARYGLAPGPDGFALVELDAVIAARGWRADVEERTPVRSGYQRLARFGAVIFAPSQLGAAIVGRPRLTRGVGDTAAAAVAQALAKLLA